MLEQLFILPIAFQVVFEVFLVIVQLQSLSDVLAIVVERNHFFLLLLV